MIIRYECSKYTLPFIPAVKARWNLFLLDFVRLLRLLKRMWIHLKSLLGLFLLTAILVTAIVLFFTSIGAYSSFVSGIWDFRIFSISTFVSSFIITFYNQERLRHNILIEQHSAYFILLSYSNELATIFSKKMNMSLDVRDCFYLFESAQEYIDLIKTLNTKEKFVLSKTDEKGIQILIEIEAILNENQANILNRFEGTNCLSEILRNTRENISRILQVYKVNNRVRLSVEEIADLFGNIHVLIETIRMPWRCYYDIKINTQIRDLIRDHGNCKLDYYSNLWPKGYLPPTMW